MAEIKVPLTEAQKARIKAGTGEDSAGSRVGRNDAEVPSQKTTMASEVDLRADMASQSALSAEVDPQSALSAEIDPQSALSAEIDPQSALNAEIDPQEALSNTGDGDD
jgi:hypothetical protein